MITCYYLLLLVIQQHILHTFFVSLELWRQQKRTFSVARTAIGPMSLDPILYTTYSYTKTSITDTFLQGRLHYTDPPPSPSRSAGPVPGPSGDCFTLHTTKNANTHHTALHITAQYTAHTLYYTAHHYMVYCVLHYTLHTIEYRAHISPGKHSAPTVCYTLIQCNV